MQVSSPHDVVLARSDVAKGAYRAVLLHRAAVLRNRFRDVEAAIGIPADDPEGWCRGCRL